MDKNILKFFRKNKNFKKLMKNCKKKCIIVV
jgi:hypothetical protein